MLSQNQESIFELQEINKYEQDCSDRSVQIRTQKKNYEGFTEGPWKAEENLIYVVFMDIYQTTFSSKSKRKFSKSFTTLARYLKTRNASQCRSHFQKLMNRHKTLKNIFKFYKTQVGEENYTEKYFSVYKELASLQQEVQTTEKTNKKVLVEQAVQTENTQNNGVVDPLNVFTFSQSQVYQSIYAYQFNFMLMNIMMSQSLGV